MYGFTQQPIGTLSEGWDKDQWRMPNWAFPDWPDWMGPQWLVSGIVTFAVAAIFFAGILMLIDRAFIRPRHNRNK